MRKRTANSHPLDLHGLRHEEVDRRVENFIFLNQYDVPLKIICGKSEKMIDLVMAVVNRINCRSIRIDRGRGVVTIDII